MCVWGGGGGRGGWNALEGHYLLTVSDAKIRLSDNVVAVLSSVLHGEWFLFCVLRVVSYRSKHFCASQFAVLHSVVL